MPHLIRVLQGAWICCCWNQDLSWISKWARCSQTVALPFGVPLLEHVLTADFSSCLRLRNGVKYCKVLRLPEVSKSALILTIHSADSEEVKRVEVELTQQFLFWWQSSALTRRDFWWASRIHNRQKKTLAKIRCTEKLLDQDAAHSKTVVFCLWSFRFCASTWSGSGMRWCIPSRSTATSPSPWKGWICGLSWPRSVSPRSPPMICCQSSAIMAQQAVSPSCECMAEVSKNKRSMSKAKRVQGLGSSSSGRAWVSSALWISAAVFPVTGGHYIAYCQNVINGQWYEFDDQYVTEVHETVVQNAEAYVLFYRWAVLCMQQFCPGCRVLRNVYGKLRVEELLHFLFLSPLKEKQWRGCARASESCVPCQHEGAQFTPVLHLSRVAQQI